MRLVERLQAEVALVHDAVIVFVLLILVELGERRGDVVSSSGSASTMIGSDGARRLGQAASFIPYCTPGAGMRSAAAGTKKSSLNGEDRR